MRPSRKQRLTDPLYKRAYAAWSKMRQRCNDPRNNRYYCYGARGIRVCERWNSFDVFLRDIGLPPSATHTIDRKDSNKNYEPGNCQWLPLFDQAGNRTNNRLIEIDGESKTLAEWGRVSGVGIKVIWERLSAGISGREIIKPVRTSVLFHPRGGRIDGLTIRELSEKHGIKYATIYNRLRRGVPLLDPVS